QRGGPPRPAPVARPVRRGEVLPRADAAGSRVLRREERRLGGGGGGLLGRRGGGAGRGGTTGGPRKGAPTPAGRDGPRGPRAGGGVRREGEPSEKMPRLVGGRRGDEYYGGLGVHAEERLAFSDGHRPQLADAFARGRGVHGNDSAEACAARREWLIGWFGELRDRL